MNERLQSHSLNIWKAYSSRLGTTILIKEKIYIQSISFIRTSFPIIMPVVYSDFRLRKMQFLVLHSLLPFLLITCFIWINLQLCQCADDPQYVNCSQAINCRDIKNISYPFWGVNRRSYWGQPGFEVKCEGNISMITTKNIKFRILEMNSSTHTVTVADGLLGYYLFPEFCWHRHQLLSILL